MAQEEDITRKNRTNTPVSTDSITRSAGSYVVRIGIGIVVGGILGVIGAHVFAWITVTTGWFIGFIGVIPLIAAGFGMALVVGEHGGIISGLIAAVIGLAMLMVGYGLIDSWLGPMARYEFNGVDLLTALVGGYFAFSLGTGIPEEEEVEA